MAKVKVAAITPLFTYVELTPAAPLIFIKPIGAGLSVVVFAE